MMRILKQKQTKEKTGFEEQDGKSWMQRLTTRSNCLSQLQKDKG